MDKKMTYAELNPRAIFGGTLARFSNLLISVKTDLLLVPLMSEWQKHLKVMDDLSKKITEQAKAEFPKAFEEKPDPAILKKMEAKYNPMLEELGNSEVTFSAKQVVMDADELQKALENDKAGFTVTTPHYIAVQDFIKVK